MNLVKYQNVMKTYEREREREREREILQKLQSGEDL